MFGNYRVMPFSGALLACSLIAGLSILCLSDARSAETKASNPKKTTVISADNDGMSVKASEKYRDAVRIVSYLPQQIGRNMTPDEAAKFEKELEENPDDLKVAAQLLGFYYTARFKKKPDPDASQKREKLILSLIQSHPNAAILGTHYAQLSSGTSLAEARELWAQQVEKNPKSIPILMNAAQGQGPLRSDGGLVEEYLLQAQALEPESLIISERLAQIYMIIRGFSGADKKGLAAKELAELTKVYGNTDSESQKAMLLPQMAKAALEIPRDLDLIDKQADLMISNAQEALKNWPSGSGGGTIWSGGKMISPETDYLFYFGYFTKGMVALKKGDTDKAVEFLLKSAEAYRFSGSLSNGPNMSLAKALLEAGQKDAVIEFLEKCGKVWQVDQGKSEKWIAEIKDGKTPDFGGSIYY